MADDEFVPKVEGDGWHEVDEVVDGDVVLQPHRCRVVSAVRLEEDGAERCVIVEFTVNTLFGETTLQFELSPAAVEIVARALQEVLEV
jgi:hypothetical protein